MDVERPDGSPSGGRISGSVQGLGPLLMNFLLAEGQRRDTRTVGARLSALVRYGDFVDEIVRRYGLSAESARVAHDAIQVSATYEPALMSPEDRAVRDKSIRANREAALDIESFYVFANILLDRWAAFVGVYFGPEPDVFTKKGLFGFGGFADGKFQEYALCKQLTPIPPRLLQLTDDIANHIAAYRHKSIVHEESPHAFNVLIPPSARIARIDWSGLGKVPTHSGRPDQLVMFLKEYFTEWTQYIGANADRCCL